MATGFTCLNVICAHCGEEFTVEREAITHYKQHCPNCGALLLIQREVCIMHFADLVKDSGGIK